MVIGRSFMCVFLATQKKDHPKTPKPGCLVTQKKQEVNCIAKNGILIVESIRTRREAFPENFPPLKGPLRPLDLLIFQPPKL